MKPPALMGETVLEKMKGESKMTVQQQGFQSLNKATNTAKSIRKP
jgi:hypothetical protein